MGLDIGMTCKCEAHLSLSTDSDEESTSLWYLAFRFANAHVRCKYMTAPDQQDGGAVEEYAE